jgi:hypothetical protein
MDGRISEIDKSQLYYGKVIHWVTIFSCLITLIAPVLILLFPHRNLLNPSLIFNAIFEGKNPAGIWESAGVPFKSGDFWKLFLTSLFTPDGFATLGIALGCSVTLWALIPAVWQFTRKKEYFYVFVSLFVIALIALAMSGLVNMAG